MKTILKIISYILFPIFKWLWTAHQISKRPGAISKDSPDTGYSELDGGLVMEFCGTLLKTSHGEGVRVNSSRPIRNLGLRLNLSLIEPVLN